MEDITSIETSNPDLLLDQPGSIVKQKEAELKNMEAQIESYNQMVKQLATQREMAIKRLSEMDQQIEELNKAIAGEKLQVEAKDEELKSKRSQLQTLQLHASKTQTSKPQTLQSQPLQSQTLTGTEFDPFANDSDPFAGDDPFKSEEVGAATVPEDDPFNPSSSSTASGGFNLAQYDPFAPPTRGAGGVF